MARGAAPASAESPFPSFFIGGFESSTAILSNGSRLDAIYASQHDRQLASDYDLMLGAGVRTVRESVRWPVVETGGRLRLGEPRRMARLLRERAMVPIWDLMHYGFPDGVDPYSSEFVERFARYARAVADAIASESGVAGWYTPINEISFMSHAAGDIGLFYPFSRGRGYELKLQLVRAAVAAMHAIREVDPGARFVHVDPLIHLLPQRAEDPAEVERVRDFNERIVFEGWQMLRGSVGPELGGQRDFMTIAGVNVYRLCQWELDNEGSFMGPDDPRWTPIRDMLADAWRRLECPLVIGETGELGPHRAGWLRYLLDEVDAARAAGVPVLGACWYPIIAAPDWYDPTTLFTGGWWDLVPRGRRLVRVPYQPVLDVVAEYSPQPIGASDAASRTGATAGKPAAVSPPPELADDEPPLEVHPLRRRRLPESWERALLAADDEMSISAYTFAPGRSVGVRSFPGSSMALFVVSGAVYVTHWRGGRLVPAGSVAYVPKGRAFGIHNPGPAQATVLQVAAPPPWNADHQDVETRPNDAPRRRTARRPPKG